MGTGPDRVRVTVEVELVRQRPGPGVRLADVARAVAGRLRITPIIAVDVPGVGRPSVAFRIDKVRAMHDIVEKLGDQT